MPLSCCYIDQQNLSRHLRHVSDRTYSRKRTFYYTSQISPKSRITHKNSRHQKDDMKQFHSGDSQTLVGTVQNLVAMATWIPRYVHP